MNIPCKKYEAIASLLSEIDEKAFGKLGKNKFIEVISRDSYNLSKDLNLSHSGVSSLLNKVFPDRPKNSAKCCGYLLELNNLKYCFKCKLVHYIEDFYNHSNYNRGKFCYCKYCEYVRIKEVQPFFTAKYKASKLQRTPKWADLEIIRKIYDECPKGYHVDHVIPLQGDLVSGLHVENNLQYLPAVDNIKKSNKFNNGTESEW